MKIEILKDYIGPYPDELHDYDGYMRDIIREIEKIGKENINKINIECSQCYEIESDNCERIYIKPKSLSIYIKNKYIDKRIILKTELISKITIYKEI